MKDFKYALRHYHWVHDQPHLFASYEEQATSVSTEINGTKAATIFLNTESAMRRALKFGWVDETQELKKSLSPEPVKKEIKRKYTKRKK